MSGLPWVRNHGKGNPVFGRVKSANGLGFSLLLERVDPAARSASSNLNDCGPMAAGRQCGRMTRRFRNYLTVLAISLLMWTVILGVVYWLFR